MKKGQAEIFGLIFIVILLIFALIFFVRIKQSDDSSVTLRSSFRANNLMNAIMDVNLDYLDKTSLKELMKDCLDNPTKLNPNPPPQKIKSDICVAVEKVLTDIFKATLSEIEIYQFKGSLDTITYIELFNGVCDEGITASPVRLPRNYNFELKLCS